MKQLLLIILTCCFASCNMSDDAVDLGKDYQLVSEGKENHQIIGKQNVYPNIIRYGFNNDFIIAQQQSIGNGYRNLISYDLSTRYIIYSNYIGDTALFHKNNKEIPINDSSLYRILKNKGVSKNNTREDIEKCNLLADSIIKVDPNIKKILSLGTVFWIINKNNDSLYGPFDEKEFIEKKAELNIPLKLSLQNIN